MILIKGIVNGEPMHTEYVGDTSWDEIKFSINLTTEITTTFKKSDQVEYNQELLLL